MRISVSKLCMLAVVLGFLTLCSQADAGGLFGGRCGGHGKLFGGKLFKGCGSSCCEETTCCEEEAPAEEPKEEAADCGCPEESCCESSCGHGRKFRLFGRHHGGGCCEKSCCDDGGHGDESSPSDSDQNNGDAPPAPEEV